MRDKKSRLGLLVLAMSLAIPVAVPALADAGQGKAVSAAKKKAKKKKKPKVGGRLFYGTDNRGNLVTFREKGSSLLLSKRAIQGLPGGVVLEGIDFRPKTGELYGIGSDAVVYRVLTQGLMPRVLPVGNPPGFMGGLNGSDFGVDFNPIPDAIRVVSDADQNIRVSPTTGALLGPDSTLGPGNPNIVGAAYTNSSFSDIQPGAGQTTLFTIDSTANTLNVQGNPNPNDGTQNMPKPLGFDVSNVAGFDVTGPLVAPVGWLTSSQSGRTRLYRVNVATGLATDLGQVGSYTPKRGKKKAIVLTGLAAVQD
jgi:hypothetical protein